MPRMPPFMEPSQYIRYVGAVLGFPKQITTVAAQQQKLRFIRLNARESPMKHARTFVNLAAGGRSALTAYADIRMDPGHVLQAFVGVSPGARVRIYHPSAERVLKWDRNDLVITEDDTANIEHEDSPIDDPRHEMWLSPGDNFVPSFEVQNSRRYVKSHQLYVLAAKYTFEFVDPIGEADIFQKLVEFKIPSKFVTFGGRI